MTIEWFRNAPLSNGVPAHGILVPFASAHSHLSIECWHTQRLDVHVDEDSDQNAGNVGFFTHIIIMIREKKSLADLIDVISFS